MWHGDTDILLFTIFTTKFKFLRTFHFLFKVYSAENESCPQFLISFGPSQTAPYLAPNALEKNDKYSIS